MQKKICFILSANIYLSPYIWRYISLIKQGTYDIIFWDRDQIGETICARSLYPFRCGIDTKRYKKIFLYLKFRRYVTKILKQNQYDMVILLQTNIAMIIADILIRKFKKKFIVDIRDYTMENNKLFFKLEESLINCSCSTVISSRAYKRFLPSFNYLVVHNDTDIEEDIIKKFRSRTHNKNRIVISCIGFIRFNEQNKKALLKFKNDTRFELRFIGKNADKLKKFCADNNIENISLIDRFPPEKTLSYYYDTDIIFNLYGNNNPFLDYALSNKLYYSAKLHIPILVCKKTYMEEISTKYGFGYTFDFENPRACDDLFRYWNSIDWDDFNKGCELFVKEVNKDNDNFKEKISSFLN